MPDFQPKIIVFLAQLQHVFTVRKAVSTSARTQPRLAPVGLDFNLHDF
jgi:hypothetical protein